jgi:hypothetical protein
MAKTTVKKKTLNGYYHVIIRVPDHKDMIRTGKLTQPEDILYFNDIEVEPSVKVDVITPGEIAPYYVFNCPSYEIAQKLLYVGVEKKGRKALWD